MKLPSVMIVFVVLLLALALWNRRLAGELKDRKRTEAALRESEASYRSFFDNATEGFFRSSPEGRFLKVSPSLARMYGFDSPEQLIQSVKDIGTDIYVHPEDRTRLLEQVRRLGGVTGFEHEDRRKDGSTGWVSVSVRPVLDEKGELVCLDGISIDITGRKRAEEALRQANLVIENSSVVVFRWRAAEGWPVEMVTQNVIQFGYTPEELLSGAVSFTALVHPEDIDRVGREVQQYTALGVDRFQQEYRIVSKDGPVHWVEDRTLVERDSKGRVAFYQGIIINITERKRAEEAVRASEANLQLAFEAARVGDWSWDMGTGEVQWSARCKALYGLSPDTEVTYERFIACLHPEDRERVDEVIRRAVETRGTYDVEKRSIWPDGSVHWNATLGRVFCDADGHPVRMAGVTLDVTDRKRVEESLIEKSQFIASLLRAIPVAVFYKDREGRYQGCNDAFTEIMGVTADEISGKTVHELWPGELSQKYHRMDLDLMARQEHQVYEFQVKAKDGQLHPVLFAKDVYLDNNGEVAGLVGAFLDITDRKRAEEALRESLAEKESLLKEVHHRVKNNLQVISSLLKLQARLVQNPELHDFLRDTQTRVRSMGLLHETLYRSGNLSRVSFPQYVKNVCCHVAHSYASGAGNIGLRFDIADVTLDLDLAIPAGLIISELVSNAFKHAFPSGLEGEILVELHTAPEGHLLLCVSDNGVGLSPSLDPHNTETLGLLLVRSLTRQLDGRLTVGPLGGAMFQIEFPAKPAHEGLG